MHNGYFRIPAALGIVIGIFIVFQIITVGLAVAFFGVDFNNAGVGLLAVNGAGQLVAMLGLCLVAIKAASQNTWRVLRLEHISKTPKICYALAPLIIIAAQAVGNSLASLWTILLQNFPVLYGPLSKFEAEQDTLVQSLVTAADFPGLLLIILLIAVIPGIAEESLFRGFMQTNIERSGWKIRPVVALMVTSLTFAAIHGSVFKFPGLLMLGLALGYMAMRTDNLLVGMLGHMFNNGMIAVALFAKPEILDNLPDQDLVGVSTTSPMQLLLVLAVMLPVGLLLIRYFHSRTEELSKQLRFAHEADRFTNAYHSNFKGYDEEGPFSDFEEDENDNTSL